MRFVGIALVTLSLSAFSQLVLAQEVEINRDIIAMGCDKIAAVCSVDVNGEEFGPDNCTATTLKFNLENDLNAEASLMLLSAAFLAGKKVKFVVSAECYSDATSNGPTFESFKVIN